MRTSYKLLSFVSVSVILLSNVCLILRMRNFYAKSSLSESYSQRLSSYVSTANDLLENDGLELSDVYLVDLSNNMFRPLKSLFLTGTDRTEKLRNMPMAVSGSYKNKLERKRDSPRHNNSFGVEN